AVAGYNRILTLREMEKIQRENEQGVFEGFSQKKKLENDTILTIFLCCLLSFILGISTADFWIWLFTW
ncbi:MAG: hypothetical protein ACFFEV_10440, partial [Candidatus Thorarchaeota archaeon]